MALESNEARWSTTQDHWCSPPDYVAALHEFCKGAPALDPCSNPNSIIGADVEWYGPEAGGTDGLLMPWVFPIERPAYSGSPVGAGVVHVNPPYSDKWAWMRKITNEHARRRREVIALLPNDSDTDWFHRWATTATRWCFWRGRMRFIGDRSSTARFPSLVMYWGRRPIRFDRVFSKRGWVT